MGKPIEWVTIVTLGLAIITGFYLRSESWLETTVTRPFQSDALDYFNYAYNLHYYHTYAKDDVRQSNDRSHLIPDALRSPGYPLLLSLVVDGPPGRKLLKKIELWQMLTSTLTLILSFFFFRCFMPSLPGGIAAMFVAISPHLIMFNSYILSETPFCFLLVSMALLTCTFIKHPAFWSSSLLGAAMGGATLIRPSLQLFPLVMIFVILLHFGRQRGLKFAFSLILGFILVLSPWLIRNVVTLGKLSDNSLMINFLHHGMYPDFKFKQIEQSYRRPYQFDPRSEEIGASVISALGEIKNRFQTEPIPHIEWFLLKKPRVFWSWDMVQGHGDIFVYHVAHTPYSEKKIFKWTHKMMHYMHWPLVIISLVGSLTIWYWPKSSGYDCKAIFVARFVAALLLYYTVLHMIGAPFPRYSVPLLPFQYGMALFSLHVLYQIVIARKDII